MAPREHTADLVVLAAGGLGTPAILQRSGIACEPRLFVDPVLTVAARCPDAWQCHELEMPFVVQRDHYILSPYFDWFSFLVRRSWRRPAKDLVGIMVKLADEPVGWVTGRRVHKTLTDLDRRRLAEGVALATEILGRFGAALEDVVLGAVNAGHPGGMLPPTRDSAASFHDARLPGNVYVADASLFPESLGNPPILTIIAMAKRIGRLLTGEIHSGQRVAVGLRGGEGMKRTRVTAANGPAEAHRSDRAAWLRAAVLGADDGIVSTASLVIGIAAAAASRNAVLVAGVAGLVAGATSMAAGEYVSVSSQRDAEQADIARERWELAADPDFEQAELAEIYVRRGLDRPLATTVAERLMEADPLASHVRDELGLQPGSWRGRCRRRWSRR